MKIKHRRVEDDTTPSMVEKPSIGDNIAHVIVVIICILIAFCSVIPMWHVLMSSLSDGRELMSHDGIACERVKRICEYNPLYGILNSDWISYCDDSRICDQQGYKIKNRDDYDFNDHNAVQWRYGTNLYGY